MILNRLFCDSEDEINAQGKHLKELILKGIYKNLFFNSHIIFLEKKNIKNYKDLVLEFYQIKFSKIRLILIRRHSSFVKLPWLQMV